MSFARHCFTKKKWDTKKVIEGRYVSTGSGALAILRKEKSHPVKQLPVLWDLRLSNLKKALGASYSEEDEEKEEVAFQDSCN